MGQLRLVLRSLLRRPLVWLGILVSAGAIALAVRGLHVHDVAHTLRETNIVWLVPAVAAMVLGLYPRVRRWQVLFYPRTGMSQYNLYGTMITGYMLNNLLPLRVGELGRAFLIGKVENVDYAQALATIFVERLLDILVLFALLIALLPVVNEPRWATGSALFIGFGTLGLAAVLVAVSSVRQVVFRASRKLSIATSAQTQLRVERWLDAAFTGFATLSNLRVLVEALFWSVLAWACSSVFLFCCLRALGIHLSYAAPLLVMVAINLGMVIPSSSGYIGVYHAIVIETMTVAFSISREQAVAFAIISHALFYVIPILLGAGYLWHRRELWQAMLSNVLPSREPEEARAPS
jgi:uncharacterized protein (TIRG00374 family)